MEKFLFGFTKIDGNGAVYVNKNHIVSINHISANQTDIILINSTVSVRENPNSITTAIQGATAVVA
jgi:hypothetical protein